MQAIARSYLEHSHRSAAFESSADYADTGYHSGSHTPCTVSLTLACSSHVGRTTSSVPSRDGRGFRLGIVYGPTEGPISGARIQKLLPYPSWLVFPDSAPSLLRLTGKGLMPLSSLSFSRSAFSAEPRRLSPSGRSVLRPPGSRRQRALHEPYEHCTRLAPRAVVTCPAGGFGDCPPHPL